MQETFRTSAGSSAAANAERRMQARVERSLADGIGVAIDFDAVRDQELAHRRRMPETRRDIERMMSDPARRRIMLEPVRRHGCSPAMRCEAGRRVAASEAMEKKTGAAPGMRALARAAACPGSGSFRPGGFRRMMAPDRRKVAAHDDVRHREASGLRQRDRRRSAAGLRRARERPGDIEAAGETAWQGQSRRHAGGQVRRGVPKNTRIVQGAPGAGKTSILAELARRSAGRDGAPGRSRVVTLSSDHLMANLPKAIRMIAVTAGMPQERWREISGTLAFGVDALLASAAGELSWARESREAPQDLHALADRFAPAKWKAPVIVAVDEAQALRAPAHAPHALFLQGIHDASAGLPLSLVLAGLGDTEAAANAMGLIRGLTIHEVDGLEASDCATLVQGFCRHFGMDPAGHEARLDALAAPCEGWPRHLHFAMQALADEALRCEGDLARVDWTRIEAEAAESRIRYCRRQQSDGMRDAARLTGAVMQGLEPGMKRLDVLGLIEDNVADRLGHRLPEGTTAKRFYTHLVHQGALQERADHTVHCPLPSFRTHLVSAGGPDPDAGPAA